MTSRQKLYALGEPFGDACTRQEAGRRIYGGGSSSSSQASSTTNVDKRQVVDNGGVGVSSDSSTVNVTNTSTDNGAIQSAMNLVNNAGGAALSAYQSLLNATITLNAQHDATLAANTKTAADVTAASTPAAITTNTTNGTTTVSKNALYIGAAVVAYIALKKG